MRTTRVFKSGNSMAIRLPKDFVIQGDEVEIKRVNRDIVLTELPNSLERAFWIMSDFPKDFFDGGRQDESPQQRESF